MVFGWEEYCLQDFKNIHRKKVHCCSLWKIESAISLKIDIVLYTKQVNEFSGEYTSKNCRLVRQTRKQNK